MATLTSKLIVALVDRVTAPSRAVSAAMGKLNAMQVANNARLSDMRGRMYAAAAAGYVLYKGLRAPLDAATEFGAKLEDIRQKIGATSAAMPKIGAAVRTVARQTTQSAQTMAEGMDILVGMGANADDALGLLPAIGRAATAYKASIADLSQAGYAALSNLKVPANQFARALDAMAQAGKDGAFELKDMAQYFPSLGAAYQGLGQKGVPAVADLAAAMQIVRKGTGDSASAATNLENILQKLYAPRTLKAFSKMGVDLRKEMAKAAKAGMTPIEAIAEITRKTLKGDLSRLGDLFQDAQVQKGLRPLIQNMEEYRKIRADAMKAQGVVEADYEKRIRTAAFATERWHVAIANLGLSIGNALLPALTALVNRLTPIIDRIAAWTEKHPALTRAIITTAAALTGLRVAVFALQFSLLWMKGGALIAAKAGLQGLAGAGRFAMLAFLPVAAGFRAMRTAMIGYAAAASIAGQGTALAMMARGLVGLLNPLRLATVALRVLKLALIGTGIGAALVGIAAAGTWIYNNWTGISTAFEAFKGAFMRAIQPIMPALQPVINGFSWLWDTVSGLLGPVDDLGGSWAAAGIAAGRFVGDTVVAIAELPGKITAIAADMVAAGRALMSSLLEGLKAGAQAVVDYVKDIGSRIKSAVTGAASGAWNRVKGAVGLGSGSPAIAGARAAGGPVRAGLPYLVGERGPEIVTFARDAFVSSAAASARIMRNAALASAVATPAGGAAAGPRIDVGGVTIIVQGGGQSAQQIAEAVEQRLSAKLTGLYNGAFHDGVN